ncbi:MAG TPA: VCBS repeat-containing protein, partial [Candidatus Marinimicrobia bacterium]|nr:VCBS repeat-containing protein [Candidatus Neomarinimicrobiota bacterium]
VADMNGDGLMDLVMANRDGDANEILMGLGGMRFGRPVVFGSGSDDTRGVAVADMNGDGLPDIVTANIGEANAVILNRGDGRFELAHTFGAEDGQSYAIVATDLD